jgi:hypothetical protein
MAQTDAMETAKEILRQIIKYRFWISISVAALFAVIAYSVGSGPIREAAAKATSEIKAAETEVKGYSSPTIPTKDYKPIVEEKTGVLTQDVNAAWRTLYERQAPLLTWPGETQQRFQTWGRQWPDKVDPKKIELAKVDYIYAYPAYVSMVYKTFNPFNYETGEGVVAAPSEVELLLPAQFDEEHLPDLGKIWAAQERLWIQRTVLEVIAEVNKNAKKWDEAIIRQIVSLDVGSPDAQDQRSMAKAETLEESKGIYAPGEEPASDGATASADAASVGGQRGMMGGMGGMGGGRRGGGDSMGMSGMGGGMAGAQAPGSVFYVKSDSDKYKILPLAVTVLIEQDRVQDFLVELENSPMWIQVKDFELVRASRVTKPEKGEAASSFGGMAGMMSMMSGMGRMGGMGGMVGMGGMAQQMQQMQQSMMNQRGMMGGGAMAGMMGGYGGMGQGQVEKKKSGKNVRDVNRADDRKKTEKAAEEARGPSLFDPFFNIVQVKVYGQARFFNAPPADAAPPPSASDTAGAAAATSAEPAAKKVEAVGQPATVKPAEKAGDAKAAGAKASEADKAEATETDKAEPKEKDAGAAAKPASPTAKPSAEKSAGSERGGASAKPANGAAPAAAPAAKTGSVDGKGSEPRP